MIQTTSAKAVIGFMEGFLEDMQPFFEMLEELGYIDSEKNLTDKGKALLKKHWEKQYGRK